MSLYRVRDNGVRLSDFNKNERKIIDKVFSIIANYSMGHEPKDTQAAKEVWIGNFEEEFLRSWFKDEDSTLKELIVLWCDDLESKSE